MIRGQFIENFLSGEECNKLFVYITFTFLHVDIQSEKTKKTGNAKATGPKKKAVRVESFIVYNEEVGFCCWSGSI